VLELLADVTAEQANQRPIPNAHTIWELVNHMRSVTLQVYRRITDTPPTGGPEEADFPEVTDPSAAALKKSADALGASHHAAQRGQALPAHA
jgi:hypothetical protein